MNPEVCAVEVIALATTGAESALGIVLVALLLLVTGALLLLLLLLHRRRRSRAAIGLLAVLSILGLGMLSLGTPWSHGSVPASAAAEVSYNGCTLIAVEQTGVVFEAIATSSLLPGDRAPAITAEVKNRFAGMIELSGEAQLGGSPLAAVLETELLFDGAAGPVLLAEGERVMVTVMVALPLGADNALQAETVSIDLVLTAIER